jgi:hypothetical protein
VGLLLPQALCAQYYPYPYYGSPYYSNPYYRPAYGYGAPVMYPPNYYAPAYNNYYARPVYSYPQPGPAVTYYTPAAQPTTTYVVPPSQPATTYTQSQSYYPQAPVTTVVQPAPGAAPVVAQQPAVPTVEVSNPAPVVAEKLPVGLPEAPNAQQEQVIIKTLPAKVNRPSAAVESTPFVPAVPEGGACTSCGSGGCPQAPVVGCECKQKEHHLCFDIYGDFLYLRPRGTNVPYAQPFNGAIPLAVPSGPVAVANPDWSSGFRVGGGVAIGDCSWLTADFAYYDVTTNGSIQAGPPLSLNSLLLFPTTVNANNPAQSAVAHYDIQFKYGDIDFHQLIWGGPRWHLDYLVGARYAHLEQDLNVTYDILGATNVRSHINFDGGGGRLGLEGEYKVCHGFYTYGKGIASLLGGHFGGDYTQRNVFAGLQAQTTIGEDRVVPQLDLELGAGWASPKGHVRLSAGYYLSSWFNTMTMPSFVQGVQNVNYTTNGNNFRDTLTFDVFLGRVEFRY